MKSSSYKTSFDYEDLTVRSTAITRIVEEARGIRSFGFRGSLDAQPGQFVMLWLPEAGARPFSIYKDDGEEFVLTIARVGPFTEQLFDCRVGDRLGYFGPFGKPFDLRGTHLALVGGGYGSAPLSFLARNATAQGVTSELVIGARNKSLLLYSDEPAIAGVMKHYCTDDGSYGYRGLVTERLHELLRDDPSIDMVYTAGPELMMKEVVAVCDEFGIDGQVSLERYMKCGFGICGSCCVDPNGLRMCVEGPCIDNEVAKGISEFGVYHRDAAGIRHPFVAA